MRHPLRSILLFVGLLAVGIGATASAPQRPDLASSLFPAITIPPTTPAAATNVLTGTAVDIANYACAALVVSVGKAIDSLNNFRQVVLEDSTPAVASWNLVDSVQIDSVDLKSYKLGYKGANRWIKALIRASNVGDTTWVTVSVLRGCARFRT